MPFDRNCLNEENRKQRPVFIILRQTTIEYIFVLMYMQMLSRSLEREKNTC